MTTDTDSPAKGELDRQECDRCGGTGEIIEYVAGRSGYRPCPSCDNIPEHELPNDPPEDPHTRLEQINERLDELQTHREEYKQNRSKLVTAATLISDVSESDHLDLEGKAVLNHLSDEIKTLSRNRDGLFDERSIDHSERTLKDEKQRLETYIEALEAQQEDTEVDQ